MSMDGRGGKERAKWTTTIIISSSLKSPAWCHGSSGLEPVIPNLAACPSADQRQLMEPLSVPLKPLLLSPLPLFCLSFPAQYTLFFLILKSNEIATALESRSHKVRYSDTLESGSIVFSLSGVAFLLMDAKACMTSAEEVFLTKIEKFINIHQNSFLVLFAPLHGPEERNLMFRIHQRSLGSNLRILPVHNTVNAVDLMCTVAKTTSKPHIDSICYRMITTKAYIIEQSPVWRTLQKIELSTDSVSPDSQ
ncbi:rCG57195, isoform CRA_b [Rattus norvegicus]|uniref:RCG57195, isoform CRA_b n=1 Tax=Rattus norvegicus TaxID=10116 RepID=A6KPJ2_RAT|nr:rCG57195, isoform CRA_b [Rattus norvegicus]